MSLANDLEEQIIDLEFKRDCYVRLAESAECPDLGYRYEEKIVDIDALIERLFRALAATPERRHRKRHVECKQQPVAITPCDPDGFEDAQTRVRRFPTAKYRAVG